jgi:hypothetical protein
MVNLYLSGPTARYGTAVTALNEHVPLHRPRDGRSAVWHGPNLLLAVTGLL